MKIGLVLSGGGARGIAHIGAVKALIESGIKPDIISGTSSGAFVGAMLAHGYTPDEIIEMILQTSFYPYIRFGFGANGLLHMNKLEAVLRKYIPENTFESLKTKFVVTATDIVSGEELQFRSGELAIPVLASCCIPGLFSPIRFQGRDLVDGGVLNNLPVEPIMHEADFIIGIHCNPFTLDKPLKRTTELVYRSLILAMHSKTKERFKKCDLLIEPAELSRFSIFDFRKAGQLFEVGYDYTKRLLEETGVDFGKLT
ncbi:patatin-like phospholipase family protein [Dyadobacter chenwenxiniae]|uniref:Patatin-like phospholipase family protein n=1 Tax=Dyadobacter chenwenxiniae TaxID=2906456 RepID=A0A9X1TDX8_9BACT|nr:patatin-like phospholipase family protein [Dyadobacter chenwenxiniae]MCF0061164.1 patatin-like phospholipase family protein [Dyadobacter chenwenxiniae]UON80990.1 patatin-like phospholipase family protein [Dyadobacter chenwenxiniae]